MFSDVVFRIEPQGGYAAVELEMSITELSGIWSSADSLEAVLYFELPVDAVVYDTYLWIEEEKIQA